MSFVLIITREQDKKITFYERIQAPDLVELLSKFIMVLANLGRLMVEEAERSRYIEETYDDDIPF